MNDENIKKHSYKKVIIFIVSFIIIILVLQSFVPKLNKDFNISPKIIACRYNLKQFGLAFQIYAQDNSGSYPTPDKWCDLIKPYLHRGNDVKIFYCPAVKEGKYHYAMNPNCGPNSPPDTVLLFETKGGWNLFGGSELLTTDNHSNTCIVCYKNGSVGRITKQEIAKLKW